MSELLIALTDELQALGFGLQGKTLFRSQMPAQVKTGVLVLARVAIENNPYTRLKKGAFQVICRDTTSDAAHAKAKAISEALRSDGVVLGEVTFHFIFPEHEPLVFPRSDGGLFEASVNYQFAGYWN